MNLISITKKFGTKGKCYHYLEKLRWGRKPVCPYCGSKRTIHLKKEQYRHHCYDCHRSFSATVGTIFEDSRMPLTKWFAFVGLMMNSKLGIAAKNLQRSIGTTYKTAWYSAMRLRCAMIDQCNIELENIVEMDEAYVGGKPRHRKVCKTKDQTISASGIVTDKPKRGRGTCKTPIIGIVERRGKIVVKVSEVINSTVLIKMLKQFVKTDNSTLMTDDNPSYNKVDEFMEHFTINHSEKQYVKGAIHTNTVEGFWAIVKNSIRGNYIKISKKYLPFYLVQAQYMYNNRDESGLFDKFMKEALKTDVSEYMEDYKPVKPVKELAYPECEKKEDVTDILPEEKTVEVVTPEPEKIEKKIEKPSKKLKKKPTTKRKAKTKKKKVVKKSKMEKRK